MDILGIKARKKIDLEQKNMISELKRQAKILKESNDLYITLKDTNNRVISELESYNTQLEGHVKEYKEMAKTAVKSLTKAKKTIDNANYIIGQLKKENSVYKLTKSN